MEKFNSLNNYKLKIVPNRRLKDKEFAFIKHLYSSNNNDLKISNAMTILDYKSTAKFRKFLNNIVSKNLNIVIYDDKKDILDFTINFFSYYSIYNNNFSYSLSNIFYNNYYSLELHKIFSFSSINSYFLYFELIKNKDLYNKLYFSIEDLKTIFNIEDSYNRFYDLEKKILNPAISDINKNTLYSIEYEKDKVSNSVNSKVKGVFIKYHFRKKEISDQTAQIFSIIKPIISDEISIYKLTQQYLMKKDFNYVLNNTIHAKDNYKQTNYSFENYFKRSLLFDLYKSDNKNYKLLLENNFDSRLDFQISLYKLLEKDKHFKSIDANFFSTLFHDILYLKHNDNLVFEKENIKIIVNFLNNKYLCKVFYKQK